MGLCCRYGDGHRAKKSQSMAVTTGMPCNVQIIWSQKYVWEVLAGRVENIMESLQGN